jgi:hypothetical protein
MALQGLTKRGRPQSHPRSPYFVWIASRQLLLEVIVQQVFLLGHEAKGKPMAFFLWPVKVLLYSFLL